MDLEELAARLSMLEDGAMQQQQQAATSQFMDKYGTKFSGDEGIGVAILAELGRRGVDTSAADEAVQDILDQIRAEATQILDKIKMDERTVSNLMDKVSTVEESVAAATGAVPGMDMDLGAPPPPDMPDPANMTPPMGDPMAAAMAEAVPPDAEAGAPPPSDAGAPPPDAAMASGPEEGGGAAPPEAPPPEVGIPSDANLKTAIKPTSFPRQPILSDARLKQVRSRIAATRQPKSFRPSASMLAAIGVKQ